VLVQLDTLYIDKVRRSASSAKVDGHRRRNVVSVVGATSSDGFAVTEKLEHECLC